MRARDVLNALLLATRSQEGRVVVESGDLEILAGASAELRMLALPFARVRSHAGLRLLASARSTEALALLSAALDDDDERIRRVALQSLNKSAVDDRFTAIAVFHRRADVRAQALLTLGSSRWPLARIAALQDTGLDEKTLGQIIGAMGAAELKLLYAAIAEERCPISALDSLSSVQQRTHLLVAGVRAADDRVVRAILAGGQIDAASAIARLQSSFSSQLAAFSAKTPPVDASTALLRLATGGAIDDDDLLHAAMRLGPQAPSGLRPGVADRFLARCDDAESLLGLLRLDGRPPFRLLDNNAAGRFPVVFSLSPSVDEERARDALFAAAMKRATAEERAALIRIARADATITWVTRAGAEAVVLMAQLLGVEAPPPLHEGAIAAISEAALPAVVRCYATAGEAATRAVGGLFIVAARLGPAAFAASAPAAKLLPLARAIGLSSKFIDALTGETTPVPTKVRDLPRVQRKLIKGCSAAVLDSALSMVETERVRGVARAILDRDHVPRSPEVAARIALACDELGPAREAFERAAHPDDVGEIRREVLRLMSGHPGAGPLAEEILNGAPAARRAASPRAQVEPTRDLVEVIAGPDEAAVAEATRRLLEQPSGSDLIAAGLLGGGCVHPAIIVSACDGETRRALLARARSLPMPPLGPSVALIDASLPDEDAQALARQIAPRAELGDMQRWVARGVDVTALAAANESERAARLFIATGREEAASTLPLDELPAALRTTLALQRAERGDASGLPELVAALEDAARCDRAAAAIDALELTRHVVDAALLSAGGLSAIGIIRALEGGRELAWGIEQILARSEDPALLGWATSQLSEQRGAPLSVIAKLFAEGTRTSLRLLRRRVRIRMSAGTLGYARLKQNEIVVNPAPAFTAQRGDDVVRGLIFHELGHHLYHADEASLQVWAEAAREKLHSLLNLVADEHLERNLRAVDESFGDALKRTAAWVFRHAETVVHPRAFFEILGVAHVHLLGEAEISATSRGIRIRSGALLGALEQSRDPDARSFARFIRALRLGKRDASDPKVTEGLALFRGKAFRKSDMAALFTLTKELQRIFGAGIQILNAMDHHAIAAGDGGELERVTNGLDDDQVQDEVRRILEGGRKRTGRPMITMNTSGERAFKSMSRVEALEYDAARDKPLARSVHRPSRVLRQCFLQLGLERTVVSRRTSGFALDRTGLTRGVLLRDPRLLRSRPLGPKADLFLGVLIDCSSSMLAADRILRARSFASMVSEAARGLRGVSARFIGFNESALFDAGDANRCAAGAFKASGGNNDAGALAWMANIAERSRRSARLLIMISDGAPSSCSTAALAGLVQRLQRRRMACAQIALRPLDEICFPHYVEVEEADDAAAMKRFAAIATELVRKTL